MNHLTNTLRKMYTTGLLMLLLLALSGVASAQQPDTITLPDMPVLQADAPLEATLGSETTAHLYGFFATEGDTITLSMTQADDSDLDPYLVLLDASGAVLAADDDSGETFLAAEISAFDVPADGSYFVLASSLLFVEGTELATTEELPYTLTLSGNTLPETDSNTADSERVLQVNAPRLIPDETITGEITPEQAAYFYVVTAEEAQRITVQMVSEQFSTVLNLFDPTGTRIAFDPSALTAFELPDEGAYLLLAADLFFYEATADDAFFTGGAYELFFSSP
jgi:hypothetical protein